jgi:predicted flap endonuclease-1-like 5' DNA nuclease
VPDRPAFERPGADDLGRIEGVSASVESALRGSGITTYAQLAGCDEFRLRGILRKAGLRFVPSLPSWPEQADLLAQGDDAGFAALSARVAADPRTAGTA